MNVELAISEDDVFSELLKVNQSVESSSTVKKATERSKPMTRTNEIMNDMGNEQQ